jgi:hypothetical protein
MYYLAVCIDSHGLDGLLEDGVEYWVRPLPCGAVKLRSGLVCAASRFEVCLR